MVSDPHLRSALHAKVAFTSIELLVVVAIIAIVASLLFPALATVRGQANSMRCRNNQRNLMIACMVYADDNDGYLPSLSLDAPLVSGARWWTNVLVDAGVPATDWTNRGAGQLTGGLFRCPSVVGAKYHGGIGMYEGAPPTGGGYYRGAAKRLVQFSHPSTSVVLMDSGILNGNLNQVPHFSFHSPVPGTIWNIPYVPRPAKGRHRGARDINVTMADGHCEGRSYVELLTNADDIFSLLAP
jgi:prepilin-type processing-associated H-X9-DG protein